jgi:hypothetical protein
VFIQYIIKGFITTLIKALLPFMAQSMSKVESNDAWHSRALHLTTKADIMCKRLHEESCKNHKLNPSHPMFHIHLNEAITKHPEWHTYCSLNRAAVQARLKASGNY